MARVALRLRRSARLLASTALLGLAFRGASLLAQDVGATSSKPPESPIARAQILIGERQFTAAEIALRQIVGREPSSADAAYLLAYVLFREQKLDDSLAAYTAAAKLRQPSAGDLTAVASVYALLKDYPDAERWLLQATRLAPDDAGIWYMLGRTQFNQDHAALATASFEHALALRPRNAKIEYNLGLAYEALQRTDDALAAYRTAIDWQQAAHLRDPQPFLDLGILLLKQQQPEQALAPLQQAAAEGPDNPLAQQEFGLALEALGRYTEALAPLQRAVQLAPEADPPHFFLGRIYRRLGRKAEAEAEYALVARLGAARSGTPTPNRDERPPTRTNDSLPPN